MQRVLLSAAQCAPAGAAGDLWVPLQFLVGNWSGAGSGQPGDIVGGTTSFSFELGKKILVRKNRAEFSPKPGEKTGVVHEDLLIIYEQPGESRLRAVYFDNEGHAINHRGSPTRPFSKAPDRARRPVSASRTS